MYRTALIPRHTYMKIDNKCINLTHKQENAYISYVMSLRNLSVQQGFQYKVTD
jgi:hypothetical protein